MILKIPDIINRSLFKKFGLLFLSMMIILSSFSVGLISNVNAATYNVTETFVTDWEHDGAAWGPGTIIKANGEMVWCIENEKSCITGDSELIQPSVIGLSRENMKYLSLIAYYGYRVNPTTTNYFLTQNAVWQYTNEVRGISNSLRSYVLQKSGTYSTRSAVDRWVSDLMKKVNAFNTKPSFNNGVFNIKAGEKLTLTDTNGVISDLIVETMPEGINITKDGNKLNITASASASDIVNIRFKRNMTSKQIESNFVVRRNGGQATSRLTGTDPYNSEICLNVQKNGNVKLIKKDNKGNYVPNTQFKVSYNSDMSSPIDTYTTGADGTITATDLRAGTVYIQETSVPDNLILDSNVHSVTVEPSETVTFTATNTLKSSLKIIKKDNKGKFVPNTQFKVSYDKDMSTIIGIYTTGNNGTVTLERLLPQTVYIQEVSVPEHLVLDTAIHSATLVSGETYTYTQTNRWKQGYIQVTKKDVVSGKTVKKAGTVFDIYNSSHTKVSSITTNGNGIAVSGLLDYGTYYVKESKAPNNYTIKVEVSSNIGIIENGKTYEVTILNQRVKGTINLSKVDSVNGKTPLGEATLEGAVYGLYARNDILDPADDSVIYNAGTKITELTTNSQGNASVSNLYLGDYYIEEIKPSYGYNIDTTKHSFSLTYANQTTEVITKSLTSKERVISRPFSIIKISSDETGEAELLQGAEFTVKSQADIEKYGSWEKAPIAKNAEGKTAKILITDEQGYAQSDRLPIGTYVVRETKTPLHKYPVADFTVTITDDSSEPIPYRIFNDKSFKSVLAVVKTDSETGKTVRVAGAQFRIKNLDTNEYYGYWEWNPLPHYVTSWTTDETGTVMTGDALSAGNYQLEEIKSPQGYLLGKEPIRFSISSDIAYETLPDGITPVITVNYSDTSVKGQISVEKRGEVLADYEDGNFVYEERGLAGMKVNIYAKMDILDPADDSVIYNAGTIVDTLTTGTDGKVVSKKLPLGIYETEEIEAPHGMILNTERKTVVLEYEDENTPVVLESVSYTNERQKVDLSLYKKNIEQTTMLSGGEFNIIADQDIMNVDGRVIVAKGTVLDHIVTDTDGYATTDLDLPLDTNFAFVETKAPIGYILDETPIPFVTEYEGQDHQEVIVTKEALNKETKIVVSKVDMTTSEELSGNTMKIFEKDNEGSIFMTWISADKPQEITNLDVNTRYILRETSSVKGFYLANDIEFELDEYGNLFIVNEEGNLVKADENKIVMENDLVKGRLEWNKQGEIFDQTVTGQTEFGETQSPVWNKSNLLGAEITIYASEDIILGNGITYYEKDEKIQTLESDWDSVQSQDLLAGKYYYVETKVPHGYVVDTNKHYFEILDNQSSELQIITSALVNDRPSVKIDLTKFMENFDYHNKIDDTYKDVVFGIFAREDIYNYMGNVAIENGTMIATSGIDELGHLTNVPDLPNGTYYIKELATNEDYVLDTNEYDFEIAYHGSDVSSYTVVIGNGTVENELIRGSIAIQKNDSFDNEKKLKDVEFNISANEDMSDIIATAKTDAEGKALFEDMEIGKYYIQEAKQVNGYTYNAHIYSVEVTTDGEILTIDVDNKPTEMDFSKVDETGVNELEGAELSIIDPETDETVEKWISSKESHKVFYLVEGKEYILREDKAPLGYETAEEITFVAGDGMTVTMKDELILTDIQVNKVDSQTMKAITSKNLEFTMYADKELTQVLDVVQGNTKDGTATFKNVRPLQTVYIKETKAPKGYKLSDEVKVITVDENLEGYGNVHSFIYTNSLLPVVIINNKPETNDTSLIGVFSILALAGFSGGIFLKGKRTKKENKKS